MTVLYSFYPAEGIVFAADTILTSRSGNRTAFLDSKKPKVLKVPKLGASEGVVGYFGEAMLGSKYTADWLMAFPVTHAPTSDVGGFASALAEDLKRRRFHSGIGLHLGAFGGRDGCAVPTFGLSATSS